MAGAPKMLLLVLLVLCLLTTARISAQLASLNPASASNPTINTAPQDTDGNSAQISNGTQAQQSSRLFPPEWPSVPFQKIGGLISFQIPPRIAPRPVRIKVNTGRKKGSGKGKTQLRPFKLVVTKVIANTNTNTIISPAKPVTPTKSIFKLPGRFRSRIPVMSHLKTTTKPPISTQQTTVVQDRPQPATDNQSKEPIQASPQRPVYYPYWNHNNFIPFVPKVLQKTHPYVPPKHHPSRKHGLFDLLAWLTPRHRAHIQKQMNESNRFFDANPGSDLANDINAAAANIAAAGGGVVAAVDEAIIAEKIFSGGNLNITGNRKMEETPDGLKNGTNQQTNYTGSTGQLADNSTNGNLSSIVMNKPVDILSENSTEKEMLSLPDVHGVGSQVGRSAGSVVSAVDSAMAMANLLKEKTSNELGNKTTDSLPAKPKETVHISDVPKVGGHAGGSAGGVVGSVDSAIVMANLLKEKTTNELRNKTTEVLPERQRETVHIQDVPKVGGHAGGSAGGVVGSVDSAIVMANLLKEKTTNELRNKTTNELRNKTTEVLPERQRETVHIQDVPKVGGHAGGSAGGVVGSVDSAIAMANLLKERTTYELRNKTTNELHNKTTHELRNKTTEVLPERQRETVHIQDVPKVGGHAGGSAGGVVGSIDSAIMMANLLKEKTTNELRNKTTNELRNKTTEVLPERQRETVHIQDVPKVGGHAGGSAGGVVGSVDSAIVMANLLKEKTTNELRNKTANELRNKTTKLFPDKQTETVHIPDVHNVGGHAGDSAGGVVGSVDSAIVMANLLKENTTNELRNKTTNELRNKTTNELRNKTTEVLPERQRETVHIQDVSKVGGHVGGSAGGVVGSVDSAIAMANLLKERTTYELRNKTTNELRNKTTKLFPDKQTETVHIPDVHNVGGHAGRSVGGVVGPVDSAIKVANLLKEKTTNKLSNKTLELSHDRHKETMHIPDVHKIGGHVGGSGGSVVGSVDSALEMSKIHEKTTNAN